MSTHDNQSKNSLLVLDAAGVWFLACVMSLALFEGQATGQCVEHKLLASDGAANDHYGVSVSISGTPGNEVAIVGAWHDNDNGTRSGSAYIYRKAGASWVEEQKLVASDGAAQDTFGGKVSISGATGYEVAIVSAHHHDDNGPNSGSAYIYRKNGATWVEEAKLLASDGAAGDSFGISISISGATGNEIAIAGAPGDDDNGSSSGAAYIYRFNGVNWIVEQKLLASDGAAGDSFGISVSIISAPGNEVVIVGTRKDDNGTNSHSAYIYRKSGATWVEEAKLLASDGAGSDNFAGSVSISGTPGNEVAIVGANRDDDNGLDSGSAYIYRFNGENWVEEQKLLASDGAAGDRFGAGFSISGAPGNEVTIVGAYADGENGSYSGSAYIYRFNGVNWVEEQKLLASDGAEFDFFGGPVSISGASGNEVAIVGAYTDDDNGSDSGSVYIFELACSPLPCPADTDGSGEVNVTDLLLLLGNWGSCPAPCPPDTNSDGSVNVTDLLDLLAAWGPCSAP